MNKILIDRKVVRAALTMLLDAGYECSVVDSLREAQAEPATQQEPDDQPPCKTHPDAPHGFLRNASHAAGRYVCECEHWEAQPEGEVVVTKDPAGQIVAVTRQDEDGHILSVIAESAPAGEPVAYRHSFDGYGWMYLDNGHGSDWETRSKQYPDAEPLVATIPQPRKPLTDEQIQFYADQEMDVYSFARAIEAAIMGGQA